MMQTNETPKDASLRILEIQICLMSLIKNNPTLKYTTELSRMGESLEVIQKVLLKTATSRPEVK